MSVMFIAVYLISPYFACALPCCPFAKISPEVILMDGVRNGYILFDMKQLFYYKTAWMRFYNHTHTVLDFKRLFQFCEDFIGTHAFGKQLKEQAFTYL